MNESAIHRSLRKSFPGEWVARVLGGLPVSPEVEEYYAEHGLGRAHLLRARTRVPGDVFIPCLERTAKLANEPLLGIQLATKVQASGILSYLTRAQPTLGDALGVLCEFQHLLPTGSSLTIVERGDSRSLLSFASDASKDSPLLTELTLAAIYLEGRRSIDAPIPLVAVRFRHPAPAPLSEYERFFGCPVFFEEAESSLTLPAAALQLPMDCRNPTVAGIVARLARSQVDVDDAVPFLERAQVVTRSLLLSRLPCNRSAVARNLGVTAATLQRRLWGERTSFRVIRAAVQRDLAVDLRAIPAMTSAEVAARCGLASA